MIHVGINAQIVTFRSNYRQAGVSRFTEQLIRALQRRDTDARYSVFLNETARGGFNDSSNMRFRYTRLPAVKPAVRVLWEQLLLPLMSGSFDVLHCPVNVLPATLGCPAVLTIHDLTFLRYPERFRPERRRYLTTFTSLSAKRAARVMTDSVHTKQDVMELLRVPADKIEVVYPGVDDEFQPQPQEKVAELRRRYGLPEEFILYVGTLEPRKNVELLLRAYNLLLGRGLLQWPLVIGGGAGWMFDRIFSEVERSGLTDRVIFPGYIDPGDLACWYTAASAFVYPSIYEGFGLPPLEAMACGTPVIVSDTSSLPEVVGDAGIKIDPRNAEELADRLAEVLQSKDKREQLAAAGRARAASFTWDRAARQTMQVYRQASR
ncbi:MAG TPA: glycosyltransferase family 1 protein [Chloroflexota bacterium]|nr:glycosyltransferase family 1 protein [Chloroflexota bacterium]